MKYRTLSRGQGVPCIHSHHASSLSASYSSAHQDHRLGFVEYFSSSICHPRWFESQSSCREPSHSPCSAIISRAVCEPSGVTFLKPFLVCPCRPLRATMSRLPWPDAASPLCGKFRTSEALWREGHCLDGLGKPANSYINPLRPPFVDHQKFPIISITISSKPLATDQRKKS